MAIEKGLYAAPDGLEGELLTGESKELEIEIVNPEMVTLDEGSVEITLIPGTEMQGEVPFEAILAEVLDESDLNELSQEILG